MQLRMTIDDALAAAREWTRGTTLHEDSDSPRVWCILMIEEIEHMRARVAMLEDAENAGSAITAMPIQIGDDLCYLPANAHGIVKRALRDAERYQWLRSDASANILDVSDECGPIDGTALDSAIDCAMLLEHAS